MVGVCEGCGTEMNFAGVVHHHKPGCPYAGVSPSEPEPLSPQEFGAIKSERLNILMNRNHWDACRCVPQGIEGFHRVAQTVKCLWYVGIWTGADHDHICVLPAITTRHCNKVMSPGCLGTVYSAAAGADRLRKHIIGKAKAYLPQISDPREREVLERAWGLGGRAQECSGGIAYHMSMSDDEIDGLLIDHLLTTALDRFL